jgi:UDP-N-acetylmuramoyl-tripeptide--D-alanyl-D-alanine ligase
MLNAVKKRLYFLIAGYFAFWARIVLWRWKPRTIVLTGSSGKTTLLHLVEAQLGDKAVYTHHANSSYGLPFFILGLPVNVPSLAHWPMYILSAPFKSLRKVPETKILIAEADCDRPNEGKFISRLLRPEAVLWVSVYRTHSMNFDRAVKAGKFKSHEQAIAYEFGHFAQRAKKLVIANGDQKHLVEQLKRVKPGTEVKIALGKNITKFEIAPRSTFYTFGTERIEVPGLHPEELGGSLQMVEYLLDYLGMPLDRHYRKLHMPPGRSSIFAGKHGTTILDSTYNTGLGAMKVIMSLYEKYPAEHKWLVIGDILEQGSLEQREHEGLAEKIASMDVEHVILLGPRTNKYTLPILKKKMKVTINSFESPAEVLAYLKSHLSGGEAILFKGGRFLEGVIEQLLANPKDAGRLVRREKAWVKRRQKWGLPR